jgi:hypothetical protein
VSPAGRRLTLDDITDLRAYERERDDFRDHVIALKKRRRVSVGPILTFVFENRDTVRFQIQEMARAERMLTDDAIRGELETYNPLIPEPGELSATLFIELTSEEQLREWLPKLAGVERAVELGVGDEVVPGRLDPGHAANLTREHTTASVHYLRFVLSPAQVAGFDAGPVRLAVDHPQYAESALLGDVTRAELLADLRP